MFFVARCHTSVANVVLKYYTIRNIFFSQKRRTKPKTEEKQRTDSPEIISAYKSTFRSFSKFNSVGQSDARMMQRHKTVEKRFIRRAQFYLRIPRNMVAYITGCNAGGNKAVWNKTSPDIYTELLIAEIETIRMKERGTGAGYIFYILQLPFFREKGTESVNNF